MIKAIVMVSIGVALIALVAYTIIWFHLHPCIQSHNERVFIPESVTYIATDGGVAMGPISSKGLPTVPITTPAHWETEEVCDVRK